MGGAIQNAGQMIGNVAGDIYRRQEIERQKIEREQEQLTEDRAALEAANMLSNGEAYWHEQVTTRSQGWKPGDPDLRESLGNDYDTWLEETSAKLPTERARMYFQRNAMSMRSRMDRGLFDFQEKRTVDVLAQTTQDGMEADFETIYRDPSRRAEVISRRLAVIEAQSRIPMPQRMEIGRKYMERANLSAESAEMERDPAGYYARRFQRAEAPANGQEAVAMAPAGAGEPARRPDFNQLFDAVVTQESGGRHTNADGTLLASPKGARGITQVMPATGRDPGYGIKPLQNESREEYIRFGREYLAAMLREFDGDTAKALAAYNAGPGRVQDAVKANGDNWLASMPAETQNYVASIGGKVGLNARAVTSAAPSGSPGVYGGGVVEFADAPESFKNLPWEQREKLRAEAEGRMRQQTAVATQMLTNRIQDAAAMARDGIVDPQPLTADAFAVLGDRGTEAFAEYQRTQVLASDVSSMRLANSGDLMAVATGAERRAQPGAGYAAEDQRDQIRAQAAAQVLKQREADPAGFVAKNVPSVTQSAQAAFLPNLSPEQRAVAVQNMATQTLAAQQALGIQSPRILSAAAVDDLTRRITQARRPEDAGLLVAALEQEYGMQYFGQVMSELERAGKLTPALRIIPNLPNAAAREMVSALSVVKMDDLKTGIDPKLQREAKEQAVLSASGLARTLPPVSGSGAALLSSYQDMIERIAYERVRTGQDSDGTAAAENAANLLLGQYQFDGQLRMPATVNARRIRSTLSSRIDSAVLPSLTATDVPMDLTRAYKPDEALAQWRDLVATNAVWYTSPDDQSLQLWVRGQNGVLYRVKQGDQQVSFSFDDLTTVQPVPARPRPDAAGRIQQGPVTQSDLNAAYASGDMRTFERLQAQRKAEQRERERNTDRQFKDNR
jgi:hypothetical protein